MNLSNYKLKYPIIKLIPNIPMKENSYKGIVIFRLGSGRFSLVGDLGLVRFSWTYLHHRLVIVKDKTLEGGTVLSIVDSHCGERWAINEINTYAK